MVCSEWEEGQINHCSSRHDCLMLKSYSEVKLRTGENMIVVSPAHWGLFFQISSFRRVASFLCFILSSFHRVS